MRAVVFHGVGDIASERREGWHKVAFDPQAA
jgi:hypothetical protein